MAEGPGQAPVNNRSAGDTGTPLAPPLVVWVFGVFCLLLTAIVILYQLTTPSDGARISKRPDSWSKQGVVLHPYSDQENNLQEGDLLVAVDGRSVESLVKRLIQPGNLLTMPEIKLPATYRLVRNGQIMDVPVHPARQPVKAILEANWGVLLYVILTQALAAFVFLRRPRDPAAQGFFIVGMTSSHFYVWSFFRQVPDLLNGYGFWLYTLVASFLWLSNWAPSLGLLLTFPRPLPALQRRRRLYLIPFLVVFALYGLFLAFTRLQSTSAMEWIGTWGQGDSLFPILLFLPVISLLIHQYRRDKAESSRKKIRLVVFTMLFASSLTVLFYFLPPLLGLPALDPNFVGVLLLLFPASIAIAILRYHLFDIDIIIRRTLVYGLLTLTLAVVYFVLVTVLQALFSQISNQQSSISIVLSTLAIAALFNPLRRRIQGTIDRRFFRRRYDAEQILQAFAVTLRDEVDIDQLKERLMTVVQETMQPESASLWIRPSGWGPK